MAPSKKPVAWGTFHNLNPEVVMYHAYALYVSDDEATRSTSASTQAALLWKSFCAHKPRNKSDQMYLNSAYAVAISFARAIARHKRIFQGEIDAAQREYDGSQRRILGSIGWSGLTAASMKFGMLAIVFGIGFNLAKVLAPFIPDVVKEETGTASPSFLLGFASVVLTRMIGIVWEHYRQSSINNRHYVRVNHAWELYNKSRLSEYRQHLCDITEMWNAYTGEEYRAASTIEAVIQDDMRTRERIEEKRLQLNESWGADWWRELKAFLRRTLRRA